MGKTSRLLTLAATGAALVLPTTPAQQSVPDQPSQFEGAAVIALVLPSGAVRRYRGALRAVDVSGTHLDTVNVVSLEYYLRGVVPREALSSWRPAARQAQAVAARTYSVFHRNRATRKAYDLCDTTSCQVYGGYDSEKASTNTAIAATAGQVRLYKGKPIIAEFSSSNGGATAVGEVPYQVMKADSWDGYPGNGNPNVTWTVTRTAAELQAVFDVGSIRSLRVLKRTGVGPSGGRALTVEAVGSKGRRVLTADQVRIRLHLRSGWIAFPVSPLDMPTDPVEDTGRRAIDGASLGRLERDIDVNSPPPRRSKVDAQENWYINSDRGRGARGRRSRFAEPDGG